MYFGEKNVKIQVPKKRLESFQKCRRQRRGGRYVMAIRALEPV